MTVSLQVGNRVKYHTIGGNTSTMNTSTSTGEIVDIEIQSSLEC